MEAIERELMSFAKNELKLKIPETLKPYFAGIGIGRKDNSISGNAGELESKLAVFNTSGDLCIRVYFNKMPPKEIPLPSSYRGLELRYCVVGTIKAG
jgi:hypothetical protein